MWCAGASLQASLVTVAKMEECDLHCSVLSAAQINASCPRSLSGSALRKFLIKGGMPRGEIKRHRSPPNAITSLSQQQVNEALLSSGGNPCGLGLSPLTV